MAKDKVCKDDTAKSAVDNASEFFEMKISNAMDKRAWDVPIIEQNSELIDVLAILCTNDHVWVVDNLKHKNVVGVITEHDILNALRPIKSHRFFGVPSRKGMGLSMFDTAEHIMSHDPFICTPDEKVKDVLHRMEAHSVRRLPVVDAKTLAILGEVTVHQLIRLYYHVIKPLCKICQEEQEKL